MSLYHERIMRGVTAGVTTAALVLQPQLLVAGDSVSAVPVPVSAVTAARSVEAPTDVVLQDGGVLLGRIVDSLDQHRGDDRVGAASLDVLVDQVELASLAVAIQRPAQTRPAASGLAEWLGSRRRCRAGILAGATIFGRELSRSRGGAVA